MSILLITKTFEELEVAADIIMPTVTSSATPAAPVSTTPLGSASVIPLASISTVPIVPISVVPMVPTPVPTILTALILTGPGMFSSSHPLLHFFIISSSFLLHGFSPRIACSLSGLVLTTLSQFEVGSSSIIVPNPVSEAVVFFNSFD